MRKIKKGDEVIVIAGKSKNKRGVIEAVLEDGEKLLVKGVNTVKKHVKQDPQSGKNQEGGILIKNMPIHRSNVMLYDPSLGKGSRVGIKKLDDGNLVRYYKGTNELVDV